MVVIGSSSTAGSWSTAFFSWIEPALFITAVAGHSIVCNVRGINRAIVAVGWAAMTLVVSFIVIGGAFANWNRVTRLMVSVVEGFDLTLETTDQIVVEVVFVIETICAVFRTFITPIVRAVVIGSGLTNGSFLAELDR